jgi:PHD-finger
MEQPTAPAPSPQRLSHQRTSHSNGTKNNANFSLSSQDDASDRLFPQLSESTQAIVNRVLVNGPGQHKWATVRESLLSQMSTTHNMPVIAPAQSSRRRSTTTIHARSPAIATPSTGTRGGRGGGRTGRKRKSAAVKEEEVSSEGETDGEFRMEELKTKSGRKVLKPTHYNPAAKTPTRRKGPYRKQQEMTVCKVCHRGHSPQSNMIVFCDGCNTPYHQFCHDPTIREDVIRVEEQEWICSGCTAIKGGKLGEVKGMSGEGLSDDEVCPFPSYEKSSLHNIRRDECTFRPYRMLPWST